MIKFIKDLKSVISNGGPLESAIIIATDTKELFVDINGTRYQISDIVIVNKLSDLDNILAPLANKFYFCSENNIFYRHINGEWVGLTSTQEQYQALVRDILTLKEKYDKITTEVNIEYVLEADKWVGNTYTINDQLFTEDSTIKLAAKNLSSNEYIALSSAEILTDDSDLANNNLVLKATGVVPTIDIPIIVSVFISKDSLDIVQDVLDSNSKVNPLSANQGRVLDSKIGDLDTLNTVSKSSIINSINELFERCK